MPSGHWRLRHDVILPRQCTRTSRIETVVEKTSAKDVTEGMMNDADPGWVDTMVLSAGATTTGLVVSTVIRHDDVMMK